MFKTVLFPIDQSYESREAAGTVASLVKTLGSRLVIVSVVDNTAENSEMASPEAIANLLQTAKDLFQQQSIDAQVLEREGKPAFVICDVADELNIDLIIMGCRGIGLTEEGSASSVTNRVINLSPCPVLVVP
ncbi:MAG: universal stress protein [Kaiparowitsia implicata GSE-PSE-MK54-09C]|jgi:nucleotide-binding universal stress UspA family protein|nr:universal stress protein [Kaiparowitsia implicata GSE-PSE-MK54-09C]